MSVLEELVKCRLLGSLMSPMLRGLYLTLLYGLLRELPLILMLC